MKTTTRALAAALAAAIGLASGLNAHRDERLEAAVAKAPAALQVEFHRSQLLAQAGHKLYIVGKTEDAERALSQAESIAASLPDPLLRDEALAHLANERSSTGDIEGALRLRDQVADLETRTKLTWKLVNKLGKAKRPEQAQRLLDAIIPEARAVEDDLHLRAELLAGTGASHRFTDPERGVPLVYEAYGIAQGLQDPYERGLFFNEIGANLVDIGHPEAARRVFSRSRELLAEIKNPLHKARFLAMLGGEQAEKGKRDAAAADLETGVGIAMDLPQGEDRYDVLSELARNLGQSYRFERGIEVANAIPDLFYRAEAYLRIAKNMVRQKSADDAIALLRQIEAFSQDISSAYQRGIVARKLASEWISLEQPQKAAELISEVLAAAAALEGETHAGLNPQAPGGG